MTCSSFFSKNNKYQKYFFMFIIWVGNMPLYQLKLIWGLFQEMAQGCCLLIEIIKAVDK